MFVLPFNYFWVLVSTSFVLYFNYFCTGVSTTFLLCFNYFCPVFKLFLYRVQLFLYCVWTIWYTSGESYWRAGLHCADSCTLRLGCMSFTFLCIISFCSFYMARLQAAAVKIWETGEETSSAHVSRKFRVKFLTLADGRPPPVPKMWCTLHCLALMVI